MYQENLKRDQNAPMRRAMDHFADDNELILKYIKELKLPTIKDGLDDMVSDAVAERWDYRRFLRTLLQREVEQRFENRKYQRIRNAAFLSLKTWASYAKGAI